MTYVHRNYVPFIKKGAGVVDKIYVVTIVVNRDTGWSRVDLEKKEEMLVNVVVVVMDVGLVLLLWVIEPILRVVK